MHYDLARRLLDAGSMAATGVDLVPLVESGSDLQYQSNSYSPKAAVL